jgi:hypothetical protein
MKKENENLQKELPGNSATVLIIDDNLRTMLPLARKFTQFSGVDFIASEPRNLASLTENQIKEVSVVFVDQFFDMPSYYERSQIFLDMAREINPGIVIIETGAAPIAQAYPNSNGKVDRFTLLTKIEEEMDKWPKTQEFLFGKLKWLGNHAKRLAGQAERISRGDEISSRLPAEEILYRNYQQLFRNGNFENLLRVTEMTEQQLIQSYYHHASLKEKALLLHFAWQIVAVLSVLGDEPDFYSLEVQKLKEVLIPEDPETFISPPRN